MSQSKCCLHKFDAPINKLSLYEMSNGESKYSVAKQITESLCRKHGFAVKHLDLPATVKTLVSYLKKMKSLYRRAKRSGGHSFKKLIGTWKEMDYNFVLKFQSCSPVRRKMLAEKAKHRRIEELYVRALKELKLTEG